MFAICVKTGIFKMRSTLFFHLRHQFNHLFHNISEGDIKDFVFQHSSISLDPGEMQTMLNKLRMYAEKKGLTVNTAKSEVAHFNSKSVSPLQNPFTYDGVVLPEKDRFKYLGMLLDRSKDESEDS